MWSSIFLSSVLVLLAACGEEADLTLEATRADTNTSLYITVRKPTGTPGDSYEVFEQGGGPTHRTVGFYFDSPDSDMVVQMQINGVVNRCDAVRVPTDGSVTTMTLSLPGLPQCQGCTPAVCQ